MLYRVIAGRRLCIRYYIRTRLKNEKRTENKQMPLQEYMDKGSINAALKRFSQVFFIRVLFLFSFLRG